MLTAFFQTDVSKRMVKEHHSRHVSKPGDKVKFRNSEFKVNEITNRILTKLLGNSLCYVSKV